MVDLVYGSASKKQVPLVIVAHPTGVCGRCAIATHSVAQLMRKQLGSMLCQAPLSGYNGNWQQYLRATSTTLVPRCAL